MLGFLKSCRHARDSCGAQKVYQWQVMRSRTIQSGISKRQILSTPSRESTDIGIVSATSVETSFLRAAQTFPMSVRYVRLLEVKSPETDALLLALERVSNFRMIELEYLIVPCISTTLTRAFRDAYVPNASGMISLAGSSISDGHG